MASAQSLFRKPLSLCTQGERGWGEGAGFLRDSRPSPPTPLPRVQGRGELLEQTLTHEATTMKNRSFLLLAATVLAGSFASVGRGAEAADPDQLALEAALLPTDAAGLANFFRLRARGEPARGTLGELLDTLRTPARRCPPSGLPELIAIGVPVLPRLRALMREGGQPAVLAGSCAVPSSPTAAP